MPEPIRETKPLITKTKTRTKAIVTTLIIVVGIIAATYVTLPILQKIQKKKPDLQLFGAVSRANASFKCVINHTCAVDDIYGSIQVVNMGGAGTVNPFKVKFEMQKADGTTVPIRVYEPAMDTSYNYNAVIKMPGFTQVPEGPAIPGTPAYSAITILIPALTGNSAQGPNTAIEIPAIIARAYLNETGQTPQLNAAKLVVTVDYGNSTAESHEDNNVKVYDLPASLPLATSLGACVVRDGSTDLPLLTAPGIGRGYAKKSMSGSDIPTLQTNCTRSIYDSLMRTYCAYGSNRSNPAQWQVALYNADGSYNTTGCDDAGCDFVRCP